MSGSLGGLEMLWEYMYEPSREHVFYFLIINLRSKALKEKTHVITVLPRYDGAFNIST